MLEVTYSYHNSGIQLVSNLIIQSNFFVALAKTLAKGKFVLSSPLAFLL